MGEHAVSAELLHDPDAYAKLLRRVHEAVLSGAPAPRPPRSVISASWDRSLAADVDPDGKLPPLVYDTDELDDVRQAHPLAAVLPLLRQNLVSIADDAEHIMIVTDADGHILWREGASGVCHDADRVLLTEGVRWSEDVIGTNAMGTVLATGEPVQVYSAEHLVRTYHTWTCAAAPVRDPETGALLGAIDVSGPLRTVHPAMLALVSASASLAEGQLKAQLAVRDERVRRSHMPHLHALRGEPGALLSASGKVLATESCGALPEAVPITGSDVALPDGRVGMLEPLPEGYLLRLGRTSSTGVGTGASHTPPRRLGLTFLSDSAPVVTVDDREIPITLRHAEILTVLAMHSHGMTADRLALELYGDDGNPVTVRAEIHRLRSQLGADVVRTKPYRLAADIDADFLRVSAALRDGDVDAVVEAFDGPLLADSEAPAVRDERESLIALVRRAVLDSGDAGALWRFWETSCGADDAEVVERLCGLLPRTDPRRRIVAAHHARLAAMS
nr:helix-turn-helix domain-containing protein [Haloechinothrix halophila]